ncbi:hypothetical protein QR680_012089 [Steinernema hermaphroditum]|uniref:SXP/RAL-2 family protein Ani s 5-like cation-binding domain-containing protein n=1 Tax=Steinernema hermaphroditum TaxID=289476 RepID=A0AA39M055_9BILA|nr:hypothetical protein QR680_012089 [Steinernema hermaphroditum]
MPESGMLRHVLLILSCLCFVSKAQWFPPQPPPLGLNLTSFELTRLQELVDSLQIEQYDKFLVDKVRQVFPHQATQRMVIDRLPLFNSPPSLSMVLSNMTDSKIQEIKLMKNGTQMPALIGVYREILSRVTPSEIRISRNILAPLLFGRYNVIEGLSNGMMFPQLPHFPINPNGGVVPSIPTIQIPPLGGQMPTQQLSPFLGGPWYGWPKPTPIYWPTYSMFLQKPFWPRQR